MILQSVLSTGTLGNAPKHAVVPCTLPNPLPVLHHVLPNPLLLASLLYRVSSLGMTAHFLLILNKKRKCRYTIADKTPPFWNQMVSSPMLRLTSSLSALHNGQSNRLKHLIIYPWGEDCNYLTTGLVVVRTLSPHPAPP